MNPQITLHITGSTKPLTQSLQKVRKIISKMVEEYQKLGKQVSVLSAEEQEAQQKREHAHAIQLENLKQEHRIRSENLKQENRLKTQNNASENRLNEDAVKRARRAEEQKYQAAADNQRKVQALYEKSYQFHRANEKKIEAIFERRIKQNISGINQEIAAADRRIKQKERLIELDRQRAIAARDANRTALAGAGLGIGFGLSRLGDIGVQRLSEFGRSGINLERIQSAFVSMLGSVEAATVRIEQLRKVAEHPGITFEVAIKGAQRFQALGLSAEQADKLLVAFANAAANSGLSLDQLDEGLKQVAQEMSRTTVEQDGLNAITERFISLTSTIHEEYGKNAEEVNKSIVKNKETVKDFIFSISDITKQAAADSETAANQVSNLSNAYNRLASAIGTALLPEIKTLIGLLTDLTKWFTKLDESTQRWLAIGFAATVILTKLSGAALTAVSSFALIQLGFGASAASMGGMLAILGPIILKLGAAAAAITAIGTVAYSLWQIISRVNKQLKLNKKSVEDLSKAHEEAEKPALTYADALEKINKSAADLSNLSKTLRFIRQSKRDFEALKATNPEDAFKFGETNLGILNAELDRLNKKEEKGIELSIRELRWRLELKSAISQQSIAMSDLNHSIEQNRKANAESEKEAKKKEISTKDRILLIQDEVEGERFKLKKILDNNKIEFSAKERAVKGFQRFLNRSNQEIFSLEKKESDKATQALVNNNDRKRSSETEISGYLKTLKEEQNRQEEDRIKRDDKNQKSREESQKKAAQSQIALINEQIAGEKFKVEKILDNDNIADSIKRQVVTDFTSFIDTNLRQIYLLEVRYGGDGVLAFTKHEEAKRSSARQTAAYLKTIGESELDDALDIQKKITRENETQSRTEKTRLEESIGQYHFNYNSKLQILDNWKSKAKATIESVYKEDLLAGMKEVDAANKKSDSLRDLETQTDNYRKQIDKKERERGVKQVQLYLKGVDRKAQADQKDREEKQKRMDDLDNLNQHVTGESKKLTDEEQQQLNQRAAMYAQYFSYVNQLSFESADEFTKSIGKVTVAILKSIAIQKAAQAAASGNWLAALGWTSGAVTLHGLEHQLNQPGTRRESQAYVRRSETFHSYGNDMMLKREVASVLGGRRAEQQMARVQRQNGIDATNIITQAMKEANMSGAGEKEITINLTVPVQVGDQELDTIFENHTRRVNMNYAIPSR